VTRAADGALGGVSVELARAFAAKLGVPIRLLPYDHPARYNDSLGKDAWDIGLAARNPSRGEHLAFDDVFMEVDNGYVARPGLSLKSADEVDRAGIRIAVAQGSAPEGFLTRNIKNAESSVFPVGSGLRVGRCVTARLTFMAKISIGHTELRRTTGSISSRRTFQCRTNVDRGAEAEFHRSRNHQ
jgi:ABC-type amino acid transport substrate-binding protein